MIETIELRVREELANQLFGDDEGVRLLGVRKVVVRRDDARLPAILDLQRACKRNDNYLYAGWEIRRSYTTEEMARAELFQLRLTHVINTAGEQCGTRYDDTMACPFCGAMGQQMSELVIQQRRLPRRAELASTLAGEWLVCERIATALLAPGLNGFTLAPVRTSVAHESEPYDLRDSASGRSLLQEMLERRLQPDTPEGWMWLNRSENRPILRLALEESMANAEQRPQSVGSRWFQLQVDESKATIAQGSLFGSDPIDPEAIGENACPLGHTLGANQLSQLQVLRASRSVDDFSLTSQYVGVRQGVFRPRQLILLSRAAFEILDNAKIRGAIVEPVVLA